MLVKERHVLKFLVWPQQKKRKKSKYFLKINQHALNEPLYMLKGRDFVSQQLAYLLCIHISFVLSR
jgi:hypothetical protein